MADMTKIVYNACYGGFSLSDAAFERYLTLKGIAFETSKDDWYTHYWRAGDVGENEAYLSNRDIPRDDPVLAQVVGEMGDAANGVCAKLRIHELQKGTLYQISEYDGLESVKTQDDFSWSVA